jgi:hypothetical protein
MRFESAKAASAQREMKTVAAMDSLSMANLRSSKDDISAFRRVNARTFILRDSVWTDQRYRSDMTTTAIKPFSKAYFDLMVELPELRAVFALGSKVVVVGRDQAIAVSDRGAESLSPAQLAGLVKTW